MLQLAYEAAAHCTSIVVPYRPAGSDATAATTPLHGRTMDWESDFCMTTLLQLSRRGYSYLRLM
jgi:penicillin V acylase-like amidase (Ntn superfamily)